MNKRFGLRSMLGMVVLFLMLCVLTVIVSTRDILSTATEQLKKSVITDHSAMLERFDSMLSMQIDAVRSQCLDVLTAGAMNDIVIEESSSHSGSYQQVANINRVIEQLTIIMNETELIRSISILFPSTGRLITNLTSYTASASEIRSLKDYVDNHPDGSFTSPDGTGYWTCYPFYPVMAAHNASRIGVFYLSATGLTGMVRKFCAEIPLCDMAILYHDTKVASSEHYPENNSFFENAMISEQVEGYSLIHFEGTDYLIIATEENHLGLSERLIMPLETAMTGMQNVERRIRVTNWIAIISILILSLLFCMMFYLPVFRLTRAMNKISGGDLSVRVKPHWSRDMGYVMQQFNHMSERLQDFVQKEYEYRLLVKEAEMKQLQYQINPHFLYNTYFQLRNLIYLEDYENAEHLASLLGAYLRYIVYVKDGDAELCKEMDHARNYADIQAMRFHDRIQVKYRVEGENWENFRVPCLLVQPLIENAFGHGMKNRKKDGVISVSLVSSKDSIDISVEDNGTGLSDETLEELNLAVTSDGQANKESIALKNIWNRVRIAFGEDSGLYLSRSALGGLCARIHMARRGEKA